MVIILMGVAGAGKTTVGRIVAKRRGWRFLDADDFHPAANRQKMRLGLPLTDADREPWLRALRAAIEQIQMAGDDAVVACSALKEAYRKQLGIGQAGIRLVYLTGTRALIEERLGRRTGHFFDPRLLRDQFAVLEEPRDAIMVAITGTPDEVAAALLAAVEY